MKQVRNITYGINILLTAMVAGLMVVYTFYFGGYFDFLLENGLTDGLIIYYAQYLESVTGVVISILLISQLVIAVLSLIFNFRRQLIPGLIIALLAPTVLIILNYGIGFSYTESTIMNGSDLSPENVAFFLKVNIPFHIVYSLCYGIGSIWLIFQRK